MAAPVRDALERLQADRIVERIWEKDPAVWREDPSEQGEILDRLGWLDSPSNTLEAADEITAFAGALKSEGTRFVVVLGMGGSSLCPEVLRSSFGRVEGYPELLVLDSTVPETVRRVADTIDPAKTAFIVSSKSGTTTEPLSFFRFFHGLVEAKMGDAAGRNFVAVTDPGTPLAALGKERGFRQVFQADPNVGGRYSALTHFGIVPAAAMGLDIERLLRRAVDMARWCGPGVPVVENPGAVLGAELGGWYQEGRDKLTFVTSPRLERFGLWAEQLIAESTGKNGRGILPIAAEPPAATELYGNDRIFAYLRLEGDDNAAADEHVDRLEKAGQPVVRESLADVYDLGASFYRWEFATAVVGALMDIHPFNQPNVQESKDSTVRVLSEYESSGRLPDLGRGASLSGLLGSARPGDYVAMMAYVNESPEVDAAVAKLRVSLLERHRLPSTFGYGPRFLHSTGQLHKGGKPNGLFIQLVASDYGHLPIPGEPYGFDVLAAAQSAGDFQVFQSRGLRVARIELDVEIPGRLLEMAREV